MRHARVLCFASLGSLALACLLIAGHPIPCSSAPLTHPDDILFPTHDGRLVLFHPETRTTQDFANLGPAYGSLTGIVRESSGDFVLCNEYPAAILRLNPATGVAAVVSQGGFMVRAKDIAIGLDGYIYEADWASRLVRVEPRTGEQTLIAEQQLVFSLSSVAVAPDGDVYATSMPMSQIVRVDVRSGDQYLVSEGGELMNPASLAFRPDGSLIVANWVDVSSQLLQIDVQTGAQTVLVSGIPVFPWALAFNSSGHAIIAGQASPSFPLGRIFDVDLATGAVSTLVETPAESFGCVYVFPGAPPVPTVPTTWGRIKAGWR
jgi:hypothetical protein